ncbi:right-handed parallel beta-helix repeat-containing protein [Nibricoccus sp. IMCC34717]|uniref:right-handed parallel beta-helix repeat-containing protein n=1 Tax=Nibricoccus sp. IMCC34717 TaxID=3034021 RepID=UPI00384FDA25
MNRREFLARTGAAAAGLAVLPQHLLAAAADPSLPAPVAGSVAPRVLRPSPESGSLPADLCAALRREKSLGGGDTVLLGGHRWNLFPEEARETVVFPSNNDAGTVKTPFLLEGLKNLVIDGEGATLLVRGTPQSGSGQMTVLYTPLVPLVLRGCENVVIRNLAIDWATPAIVQGRCVAADPERGLFEVEFEAERNLWCWNGFLFLVGEGWTHQVHRLLSVEAETGAISHGIGDNLGMGYEVNWQTEVVSGNRIRFRGPVGVKASVGALILGWCTTFHTGARRAPAFVIEDCRGVTLEDVRIHHAWGMGVIAQASTDLSLKRVVVEPSGARKFSLAADATHFVNCRGRLDFEACRFQNQFDDGINAHGLYRQIVRRLDERTLRVRVVHPQHQGVRIDRLGDECRLAGRKHMDDIAVRRLAAVSWVNSEMTDLTFDGPVPAGVEAGDVVENISAYPAITIRNCDFRWNRARGVLVNGCGPIVIEGNRFENAGAAVMVESSGLWGESGPVSEVRIASNTFRNCAHVRDWGAAVIQADPEFRREAPAGLAPFHGRLVLEGNRFENCHSPHLDAKSFREVVGGG